MASEKMALVGITKLRIRSQWIICPGFKSNDKCPCGVHLEEQKGHMQTEAEIRTVWTLETRRVSTLEASGRLASLPTYFDRS